MLELAPFQVLVLKLEQIDCVGGENTQAPYIVAKSNNWLWQTGWFQNGAI